MEPLAYARGSKESDNKLIRLRVWIVIFVSCVPIVAQQDLSWHSSYADALAEAQTTGKPIFLEYRCSP